jgi:putative transposase
MRVDHTDLNKHCPKDPFGLPRIDQVIDSTAGYDLLCFLDYYSGYHQIAIKEEDRRRPRSSPRLASTATRPCPSG